MPTSPEPIAELERRCKELGIPLTVQRRAVFVALADRDDHPTAEEIFADIEMKIPGISKATAYRTLDTLVKLGLVVRVSHPGSMARYDAKTFRHHHIVCDACGAVADLESKALDRLRLPDLKPKGFVPRDFSVHVRGLCEECAGKIAAPKARTGTRTGTKTGKTRR